MRVPVLAVLSAAAVASLAYPGLANWGRGGCAPAGPVGPMTVTSYNRGNILSGWHPSRCSDGSACHLWYTGGRVAASWDGAIYRTFDGSGWSAPVPAPWETSAKPRTADDCDCCGESCPCKAGGKLCGKPGCPCVAGERMAYAGDDTGYVPDVPTGVDADRIGRQGERVLINGRPVTKSQGLAELQAPAGADLPDDANKLRLTIIGPESDRKRFLADFASHAAFAPVRDRLLVQDYDPGHWVVAQAGFKTDGKPTIYLQHPPNQAGKGKVLLRLDDYPGAEQTAEAIRKADPSYDPNKDPNGRKSDGPAATIPAGWIVGGFAVLILLLWRTPTSPIPNKVQ